MIDLENPSPRLPLSIIADTSSSMGWGDTQAIDLLNRGLKKFCTEVEKDEVALMSVETSIISCGAEVKPITNFENIYDLHIPKLEAYGGTPLGEAILLGLEELDKRKQLYKAQGIQYYQPMMMIMTDGYPTSDIKKAIQSIRGLINSKKLTVICVGIGEDADINILSRFSDEVVKIDKLEFDDLFTWLSASVSQVSNNDGSYGNHKKYDQWKTI